MDLAENEASDELMLLSSEPEAETDDGADTDVESADVLPRPPNNKVKVATHTILLKYI